MTSKTALIAGSSGLVGNELLQILINSLEYEKIYSIVRKPQGMTHPKLVEMVCNFDHLDDIQEIFHVNDVFCCLGTTIKKAKTKEAMYKVDVEYPITIAKLAKEKGVKHFLLISSMNANSNSPFWYPKMKGMLEEQLQEISFQTTSIFQPSLLLGDRKEFRLGENLAAKIYHGLSFLLKDTWKSRLAIEAKTVAIAMYRVGQLNQKGVSFYKANTIEEIAEGKFFNQ